MSTPLSDVENKLWSAADNLRANSGLRSSEYSAPVLGLLFLRFADERFESVARELKAQAQVEGSRRSIGKTDYLARGVVYLPPEARYDYLLKLPESENLGKAVNEAMKAIEEANDDLKGALPKNYTRLDNATLGPLLRVFAPRLPSPHGASAMVENGQALSEIEGDAFGKIYEYFLGKFAMSEGQKGGEFFTPTALVRLIVEVIEPFNGRILDPACGSGGMFVQSARFVAEHRRNPNADISIYGQEKVAETIRLCRMNLAVNGLTGDIKQANTFYENVHNSFERFDFVMANPPFNLDGVDKERIKDDTKPYPFGMPKVDNANYLWIQQFYSALNARGRAGFVMANSASDARSSEQEIRRQLIEDGVVDVMVAIGPNFFYTVTLPCTLWFFDKGKRATPRRDQTLFIDARHLYQQVDRAHREFRPDQIEFLANIVRLWRGEAPETRQGSGERVAEVFPGGVYRDVAGLCKVATITEIAGQGWSLNPGRYVGVAEREAEAFDFREQLEELSEEFERLTSEAHALEERISANVAALLEAE